MFFFQGTLISGAPASARSRHRAFIPDSEQRKGRNPFPATFSGPPVFRASCRARQAQLALPTSAGCRQPTSFTRCRTRSERSRVGDFRNRRQTKVSPRWGSGPSRRSWTMKRRPTWRSRGSIPAGEPSCRGFEARGRSRIRTVRLPFLGEIEPGF